jgi:hypothetical protein
MGLPGSGCLVERASAVGLTIAKSRYRFIIHALPRSAATEFSARLGFYKNCAYLTRAGHGWVSKMSPCLSGHTFKDF